jgi:protein-glutamine gamma-glutamyltransferase
MDLAQTFRKLAFFQVLLGIVTFCYAEANPGMLLIAGSFVVLSRYVTEGPSGKPVPRWIINLMAVGALGWLVLDLLYRQPNILVSMGHFTMSLQVLVMFARRGNREYGQLLILSLLQMIGASVLSVSIIYGALLAVYCVLALMTVLVFQLKNSSDGVYEANRCAASDRRRVTRPKPVVGKGYRWQLRLTASLIAAACALAAAGVFVLSPRSGLSPMEAGSDSALGPRQIGFSQQVRLDRQPIGVSSKEPVMNLKIQKFGQTVEDGSWLMRGAALDTYDPLTHSWKRGTAVVAADYRAVVPTSGLAMATLPFHYSMMSARITLRQIGHRNLFTYQPVTSFQSDSISSIVFNKYDQQLSSGGSVLGAVVYTIGWPVAQGSGPDPAYTDLGSPNRLQGLTFDTEAAVVFDSDQYARGWPVQRDRIAKYTLEILDGLGLTRDPEVLFDPNDQRIAQVLSAYLRRTSTYQINGARLNRGGEPTIEFLFNHHTGHCELFASGLAAMTRSIGMQARVVTGFRASEYNQIGGYYVVRQSDAHAWTEVNLGPGRGWKSFDATPSEEIDRQARMQRNWITVVREAYEYIEFGWIRSIVAYDAVTRKSLLARFNDRLKGAANDPNGIVGQVVTFVRLLPTAWRLDRANTAKAVGSAALAAMMTAGLLFIVVVHRRRLARLKLGSLAPARQRELVKQLGFYLDMTTLLERHGHVRPAWQNPREYALALWQARPQQMQAVLSLTDLFYRGRFGHVPLGRQDRQQARSHLKALERALGAKNDALTR